jgi:hypothetical protein
MLSAEAQQCHLLAPQMRPQLALRITGFGPQTASSVAF